MAKPRPQSVNLDLDDYSIAETLWEDFRKVPVADNRVDPLTPVTVRRTLIKQGSVSFDYYDSGGKTPLMTAVEKGYIKTTLNLLMFGSNPNLQEETTGNTALHLAVARCDITLVKALLTFNVDPTLPNKENETPLDIAESLKVGKSSLSAKKHKTLKHCIPKHKHKNFQADIDGIVEALIQCRDCQAKSQEYFARNPTVPSCAKNPNEIFLLSIDGGGVRIFNSLQALINIEERMADLDSNKRRLYTYFDYIAGTSAGGMAACCLSYLRADSYNVRAMISKGLIHVLNSPASMKGDRVDQVLQDMFTEEKCMSDLNPRYRVIVTSALTDYSPYKLHLMTSYGGSRDGQAGPKERKVWEACRISSSAPSYFPKLRDLRLLDGGLLANNPTLESMTEIIEQGKREGQKVKFGCVLSIGTGHVIPTPQDETVEFFATSTLSIFHTKNLYALQSLASHFVNQATLCDGQEVARARAFCDALGSQYFRLTHTMKEEIDMVTTDENKLISMIFEAQMYYLDNPKLIDDVAKCLLSRK